MSRNIPAFIATLAAVVSLAILLAGTYTASVPLLLLGAFGLLVAVTAAAFFIASQDK